MVALINLGLSVAATLTVIAVAWGVFSTRVTHLEDNQRDEEETREKEAASIRAEMKAIEAKNAADIESLKVKHSDTAVRLARIEEQQAQSISLLGELKALLTQQPQPRRRR
jgi:type VI protein secretion system component VasK